MNTVAYVKNIKITHFLQYLAPFITTQKAHYLTISGLNSLTLPHFKFSDIARLKKRQVFEDV